MPKAPDTWRAKARAKATAPATADAPGSAMPPISEVADALTMAAMQGDEDSVAEILASGVSADCKDAIGVAPLHWAAFCGHGGVTGRLIVAHADVHVRDQEGRTPLHVAAYESHSDVIGRLLEAGADVMAPDKMSWTPLHCAVSNGEVAACKQLTDAGADPLRKDAEGKSAMDLAKHFGDEGVLAVMEGAQEQTELLALKNLGIGSHRGPKVPTQVSPSSVSSPLKG